MANSNDNIIKVILDTEKGPQEHEVDLDSLSLDELAELVSVFPGIQRYFLQRVAESVNIKDDMVK